MVRYYREVPEHQLDFGLRKLELVIEVGKTGRKYSNDRNKYSILIILKMSCFFNIYLRTEYIYLPPQEAYQIFLLTHPIISLKGVLVNTFCSISLLFQDSIELQYFSAPCILLTLVTDQLSHFLV